MGWQLFSILWMVTRHTEYYVEEVYALSDAIEGIGGYLLLIAMVLTSFNFGRRRLSARQWKILHTVGIYFLWTYAWITYWWHLFYYDQPVVLDYVYYWMGSLAWVLRMAAWTKKRWPQATGSSTTTSASQLPYLLPGVVVVAIGIIGITFGSPWGKQVYDFGFGVPVLNTIGVYTPFFPFVPYYPILLVMSGSFLILKSRSQPA
jgi:hypothetical protein